MADPAPLSRRRLLTTGAAAAGGAVIGAAGGAVAGGALASPTSSGDAASAWLGSETVAFHGPHQAGILTPPQAFATWIAFDLRDGVDREAATRLMRIWTEDSSRLAEGRHGLTDTEPELATAPGRLTVTVGFGPGFFVATGTEDRAPRWLKPLPAFSIDRLDERWNGGDLVLQICADDPVTVSHATRLLTKEARSFVTVRWVQHGFRRARGSEAEGTTMRNLMGQVDGTRNVTAAQADRLVWIGAESARRFGTQPEWITDGTSLVIRRIAMNLDTWDELDRPAREESIGRRLADGAPLTGKREHDEPDLEARDELGLEKIASFAHIRRARSDDPDERFLRRSYNYDQAPAAGTMSDSGQVFVSFQADVEAQFLPIQRRLDELDLLNQWTTPIGSAVFAVPPGVRPGDWWGSGLLS